MPQPALLGASAIFGYPRSPVPDAAASSRKGAIRSIIDGIDVGATEPVAHLLSRRLHGYEGQLAWRNPRRNSRLLPQLPHGKSDGL